MELVIANDILFSKSGRVSLSGIFWQIGLIICTVFFLYLVHPTQVFFSFPMFKLFHFIVVPYHFHVSFFSFCEVYGTP